MGKVKDRTGRRYGKLAVLERVGSTKKRAATWLCQCDCGNQVVRSGDSLHYSMRRGASISCGCLKAVARVGNRYSHLVVLRRAGSKGKNATWLCQCDCGGEKVVSGHDLHFGLVQSCGCLAHRPRAINLVGDRYGHLVVLEYVRTRCEKARTFVEWLCRCDCGGEKIVTSENLRRGHTKSCGCLWRLPPGVAMMHRVLEKYQQTAQEKGYEWALTEAEFVSLTSQPCHYCGVLPFRVRKNRYQGGDFVYNGLDRKDNTKGYMLKNVVPCCWPCNNRKGAVAYDEFMAWVKRVYEHRELGS